MAAVPPNETLAALVAATAEVRASAPELRWAEPSQWHVTLVFLGSVPPSVVPELRHRLARVAARHRPVAAAVAGAGRFGDQVLWLRVTGDLRPLAAGVRRAAERSGVTGLDTRRWRAHLTLARTPKRVTADLAPLVTALGALPPTPWQVNEVVLMRSEPGPRPTYVTVNAWPLFDEPGPTDT